MKYRQKCGYRHTNANINKQLHLISRCLDFRSLHIGVGYMAAMSFLLITHFSDCLTQKTYPLCCAPRRCGILTNLDSWNEGSSLRLQKISMVYGDGWSAFRVHNSHETIIHNSLFVRCFAISRSIFFKQS